MHILHLKCRKDFLLIKQQGEQVVTKGIILQGYKRPGQEEDKGKIRVGITATRKLGNAVTRNRIKRRLREVIRKVIPPLSQPGYDFVLIGRMAIIDRDFDKLQKDLVYAIHNVGAGKKEPA